MLFCQVFPSTVALTRSWEIPPYDRRLLHNASHKTLSHTPGEEKPYGPAKTQLSKQGALLIHWVVISLAMIRHVHLSKKTCSSR